MANLIKKLPASEHGHGVRCLTKDGNEFTITHCPEKNRFTLWAILNNGYLKIADSKSPKELYNKIPWKGNI